MQLNNAHTRGRAKRRVIGEINMTPMVDVMLVLLVIFMITSPMLIAGVEVELPETNSKQISKTDVKPLVITIDQDVNIYLFETQVKSEHLVEKLKNVTKHDFNATIFVKGDRNLSYGDIMSLMSQIQNAGFTKVALISNVKNK